MGSNFNAQGDINLVTHVHPPSPVSKPDTTNVDYHEDMILQHIDKNTPESRKAAVKKKHFYEIKKSLQFRDMDMRQEAIPKAFQKTFRWMLEEDGGKYGVQTGFCKWLLENSDRVYWVSGKPGSGKSTLMKYVLRSSGLKERLQVWACDKPLVLISYYFWMASTSEIAKSQEGMLRSLLSQILDHCPEFLRIVAHERLELLELFDDEEDIKPSNWTRVELETALCNILAMAGSHYRFALFIDGLDEYIGEHEDIIALVDRFRNFECTKVCISSRPLNIFSDAFRDEPSIRMQDITRPDIEFTTEQTLKSCPGFQDIEKCFPEDAKQIQLCIVEKACGVFLWVTLILKILRKRLRDGETIRELQRTVDAFPDDLDGLYRKIWDSIEATNKTKAAFILQMMRIPDLNLIDTIKLDTVHAYFASESNDINAVRLPPSTNDLDQLAKRRIASWTRGILEVGPDSPKHLDKGFTRIEYHGQSVDYLHRTAYDWIHERNNWQMIMSSHHPGTDTRLSLLKVTVLALPRPSEKLWGMATREFEYDTFKVMYEWFMYAKCIIRDGYDFAPKSDQRRFFMQYIDTLSSRVSRLVHSMPDSSKEKWNKRLSEDDNAYSESIDMNSKISTGGKTVHTTPQVFRSTLPTTFGSIPFPPFRLATINSPELAANASSRVFDADFCVLQVATIFGILPYVEEKLPLEGWDRNRPLCASSEHLFYRGLIELYLIQGAFQAMRHFAAGSDRQIKRFPQSPLLKSDWEPSQISTNATFRYLMLRGTTLNRDAMLSAVENKYLQSSVQDTQDPKEFLIWTTIRKYIYSLLGFPEPEALVEEKEERKLRKTASRSDSISVHISTSSFKSATPQTMPSALAPSISPQPPITFEEILELRETSTVLAKPSHFQKTSTMSSDSAASSCCCAIL